MVLFAGLCYNHMHKRDTLHPTIIILLQELIPRCMILINTELLSLWWVYSVVMQYSY